MTAPFTPDRSRHVAAGLLLLSLLASGWPAESRAQFDRPWRIYLVPFSHTDVGYTAPVADVIQEHIRYIDTVVAFVGRTRGNDPGTRFRWTIEIPWVLDDYIAQRSQAQIESLMTCVRNGEIEVAGIHFSLQTDLCGNEELVRSLYFAQELRDRYGITIRTAMTDDTPGFTWSLAGLLPGAGISYFSVAMNSFLSNFYTTTTLPDLFYWQGQGGGATTLVHRSMDPSWAYLEGAITCGVYATPASMQTKLTAFLQQAALQGYPYNEIMINCATGDNGAPDVSIVENARQWNAANPSAQVILATVSEFFDRVATSHAGQIPTFGGDAPNWWTWLFAPSATGGYARSRRAQRLLPAAETFSTVASMLVPGAVYPERVFRDAYVNNLLFEDHNLGATAAAGNVPFWSLKMGWVNAAGDTADDVLRSSLDALAHSIRTGASPAIAVFNPLGWVRSVPVTIPLSAPELAPLGVFDVVDGGNVIPVQVVTGDTLAFIARDVPSVGYRVYRLVPRGGSFPLSTHPAGLQLENDRFRVRADPATGAIASIVDKGTAREIVSPDGQFNQYRFNSTFPPTGMTLAASDSGPVLQRLTLTGTAQGTNGFTTTTTLYAGLPRIDFNNAYDRLGPVAQEDVDWAFHFAFASPTLSYEIPFGSVRLFDDELPGFRVNHYAARNWLNVSAGAGDGGGAVTLAMDNATVIAQPSGAFSGALRMLISFNDPSSAYRAGIGPLAMNFSLSTTPSGFHADSSMRSAYNFVVPSPFRFLPAGQTGTLDSASYSFLAIDPPGLLISTIKGPMSGTGIIVRLFNPLPASVNANLVFRGTVLSATETSLLEVNLRTLAAAGPAVSLSLAPYEVKTIRVDLAGTSGVAQGPALPREFSLAQNYPNPFNGMTTILYRVGSPSEVMLTVYDLLGRQVRVLSRGASTAGSHAAVWDGRDASGRPVASGVYFFAMEARTTAGDLFRQTRHMVYVK